MTTINDPQTLFHRWFDAAVAVLEKHLDHGDGAIAALMVTLPLYERFTHITKAGDAVRPFYQIMAHDLQLPTANHAKRFWTTFRHGFCHSGMPFQEDLGGNPLPGVSFRHDFPTLPTFHTDAATGKEVILLNPWGFAHRVLDIYRANPALLEQHPDAPLLPIHVVV
jgi:hypothetical protein